MVSLFSPCLMLPPGSYRDLSISRKKNLELLSRLLHLFARKRTSEHASFHISAVTNEREKELCAFLLQIATRKKGEKKRKHTPILFYHFETPCQPTLMTCFKRKKKLSKTCTIPPGKKGHKWTFSIKIWMWQSVRFVICYLLINEKIVVCLRHSFPEIITL